MKKGSKKETLEDFINKKRLRKGANDSYRCKELLCVARARFYLPLARLGKTLLGPKEQELLKSELHQSRRRMGDFSDKLNNFPIRANTSKVVVPNNVFLFDSTQGKQEYLYRELAKYVHIDRDLLPAIDDVYKSKWSGNNPDGSNNVNKTKVDNKHFVFDICLPKWEEIRQEILPMSYTLGRWLLDYFIPASYERDDITIPNVTDFTRIVHGYLVDPCNNTLVRNETTGEFHRPLS